MKIPILELVEHGIKCRIPSALIGKTFSLVNVGACNFRCLYCCKGGGLIRQGFILPGATYIDIYQIKNFIKEQAIKGNPIKISGGEPTVFMDIAVRLIRFAKIFGAYVSCDTSGWEPERALILANEVNQLAIDLKGPSRYIERVSGVNLKISWENPLMSIKRTAHIVETLEVRTPIFNFTSFDDLLELSTYIPDNAYWILRRFINDGTIDEKGTIVKYPPWIASPSINTMKDLVFRLAKEVPRLKNRIIILLEKPRLSMGFSLQNADTK